MSVIAGDAVTITDNQLRVEMVSGTEGLITDLGAVSGTSLLVANNTFRELRATVALSATTTSVVNTTAYNHASHPIAQIPADAANLATNKAIPPI